MAHRAEDVRLRLPEPRVRRAGGIVQRVEPSPHRIQLVLDPARERDRLARVPAHEAGRARDPVREHERAEAARLGRGTRATVERVREPALGVRQRDVDLLLGAAPFLDPPVGLGQRVLAERDQERPHDRHRRHRHACQRLLRGGKRREVVRGDLAVEPERLLPGADRRRIVLPWPALDGHSGSLRRRVWDGSWMALFRVMLLPGSVLSGELAYGSWWRCSVR